MAETKKRVRRKSAAIVRINVVREETVWKPSRDWRQVGVDPMKFEYVDEVLPKVETTSLLEQTMPEAKFDLAKVIKALNGL